MSVEFGAWSFRGFCSGFSILPFCCCDGLSGVQGFKMFIPYVWGPDEKDITWFCRWGRVLLSPQPLVV